ncbi:hypothetical protein DFJ74DRAFT_671291 [Hyaloraphidium curvatum]|nr:hypothetical protein DFJ74DRAFT_671291 [Hyaloraphidium curvatum]
MPPPAEDDGSLPGAMPTAEEEQAIAAGFSASAASAPVHEEKGKVSAILGFLKNAIGVKDLGSLRISLPASVCDPLSFLEHMVLMDQPQMFLAIPEYEEAEQQMIAVLRFLLSTNGVHMRKLYKSYNPILSERYTCYFEPEKPLPLAEPSSSLPASSRASASSKFSTSTQFSDAETMLTQLDAVSEFSVPESATVGDKVSSNGSIESRLGADDGRIIYITEQVSHHPPKMAFAYACPARQLSFTGICHISGRFTGTSVKLRHQYGMELTTPRGNRMERYRMTFPRGSIKGFVTLSPYVQLEDVSMIYCPETGLRTVIHYKDEKWYSVSRTFAIEGFIARMKPTQEELPALKNPEKDLYPGEKILYTFTGDWQGRITITNVKTSKSFVLIDMAGTDKLKKHRVEKPAEKQASNESQQVWADVNAAILAKDFSAASRNKTAIEERQRTLNAARKKNGITTYAPQLFDLLSVKRFGPDYISGLEDFPTDDCPVDNKTQWIRASLKPTAFQEMWEGPITTMKDINTLGREIDTDIKSLERGIRQLKADDEKDREVFSA